MSEEQKREQEKTIDWYKAQAKEMADLKRMMFHLWKNDDDVSLLCKYHGVSDEYFPNKVVRKYKQLEEENTNLQIEINAHNFKSGGPPRL